MACDQLGTILGALSPRTVDLYEQRLSDHALRLLGPRTRVADLTVTDIRRSLIDRMKREKLGGSTIRGTVAALSGALRFAVPNGTIPRSPVRDLERGDLPSAKRKSEPRYLTTAEVEALLTKLSHEFRPVAATLFYGTLRISEGLALTWADVDFENATIAVPGTKTEASKASHDLRHSAAGLAFESFAVNEVSRLLRHAHPRVTTTVYGGLSDKAAAGIGEKLKNAGFGARNARPSARPSPETTEGATCHPSRFSLSSSLSRSGRYWARTSDPQLVDWSSRSRRFAQVRSNRTVDRNPLLDRTPERTRTNAEPCHPCHARRAHGSSL